MMRRRKALQRRESGQGMTESIIIVALLAIAAIGMITIFGQNLRALFASSAGVLGGDTNATLTGYGSTGSRYKAGSRTLSDFGNTGDLP